MNTINIAEVNQNFSNAISNVDQNGMIIIERHKKPAYVLMTIDNFSNLEMYFREKAEIEGEKEMQQNEKYTLHEAMKIILLNEPNNTMRYNELADKIWNENLYKKRDGKKATAGQIFLRAKNYPSLFEKTGEKDHFIRLK